MPFVPPDTDERSLTEVLAFIVQEDGCSRIQAWDQFRQMVRHIGRWLWSAFWADRHPLENVGPFGGWEDAILEDDDRVRFPGYPPRRIKIVLWSHFLLMWRHHQPPSAPQAESAKVVRLAATPSPTLVEAIQQAQDELGIPGSATRWNTFNDRVRKICGVTPQTRGFSDRNIERAVHSRRRQS